MCKFKRLLNVKTHMKIHLKDKLFSCHLCLKEFVQASSLKTHYKMHADDRSHSCPLCEKRFLVATNLRLHIQRLHMQQNQANYICYFCQKEFQSCAMFSCHIKCHVEVHKRNNVCKVCHRACECASKLKHHMISHSADRSFVCAVCNQTFKYKGSLARHGECHMKK